EGDLFLRLAGGDQIEDLPLTRGKRRGPSGRKHQAPAADLRERLQFGHCHARPHSNGRARGSVRMFWGGRCPGRPVSRNVRSGRWTDRSILVGGARADRASPFGIVVADARCMSEAAPIHADHLGHPICFGVYRAIERIGAGGMGIIFRAQDMRDGRAVAIKTVRSAREADALAIRREIVTLSALNHPGIVRMHGYGVQPAGPWIALELLRGRTLADELSWFWPETRGYGEPRERTEERPTAPARNLCDRLG